MSKPLELVVWRRTTCGELGIQCRMGRDWCPFWVNDATGQYVEADTGHEDSHRKRLTPPELAAEHHSAVLDVYRSKVHGVPTLEALDRMAVVLRFATHDHFDEGDAE